MSRNVLTCFALAGLFAVATAAAVQPSAQPEDSSRKLATSRPRADESQQRSQAPLRLDLTPALESPLITDHITDDGATVAPLPGNCFVTLPVRYDRDVAPQAFSKTMIRGRDAKWFYGLRLLQVRDGRPRMELSGSEPIYERIELKPADAAVHQLIARNNAGPRREDKDKAKQERQTSPSKTLPASGWMAMVLEAPKSAGGMRFQWAGGDDEEEVDLEFLRQVQGPVVGPARLDPSAPAVAAALGKLSSPSSAMAAVAIRRLEQLRQRMGSDVPASWSTKVDAAVVAAAGRKVREVQAAAWSYLASYERLPDVTIRHISEQNSLVQRRWAEIAKSRLDEDGRLSLLTATQVLCGVLRSDDATACEAALETLLDWESDVNWDIVQGLSEKAQLLMLARLESSQDQELTDRLLTVLMKNVRPATADKIAARAGQSRIRLLSPVHPLLAKWRTMKNAREKAAFLAVLGAVDLGDLVYSRPFADLIEEATSSKADESLREAAFQLLIQQADRSRRASGWSDQPAGENGVPRLEGRFPVLVSRKARDPLVKGLVRGATRGSRRTRVESLAALLAAGYAEEAEQAFAAGSKDDADRSAVLSALFEQEAAARSYGLSALLGRLLCKESSSICPAIVGQLDRVAEQVSPADRWQVIAAVKAGVRFDKLYALGLSQEPSEAQPTLRWMYTLGHMTPQDRQRLAAGADEEERFARLVLVDQRRAFLVDGRYGVMAILEVLDSEQENREHLPSGDARESAADPSCRWSSPRRITVVLPPLRIESSEQGDSYSVLWGSRSIGRGLTREPAKLIRHPDAYCVKLVRPDDSLLGIGGWGWELGRSAGEQVPPPREYEHALGPAVMPTEPVPSAPQRGTMTLDLAEYLRAGLKTNADLALAAGDAKRTIPRKYQISLQYAAFGSYYGIGPQAPLPSEKPRPGRRHLLNVALILERME
jgi:hypothetical protein